MVRRDMESIAKRYWKLENTTLTFAPIDQDQPRLGGRVVAKVMGLDIRTLTPYMNTYHGVYGEDFVSYGRLVGTSNPLDDDNTLLKVIDGSAEHDVIDRHNWRFENNQVTYSRDVNAEHLDSEVEHAIA